MAMDEREQQIVLQALLSARASIDLALSLLVAEDQDCPHPPQRRQNLAGFGSNAEHWRCKDCGYEHKGVNEVGEARGE